MAGGMEIFIDGSGMDEQPHLNTVLFNSTSQNHEIAGTKQDIDDEIQSSTTMGLLAYTLPSLPDLYGGVPMSNFNQHFIGNNNNEGINYDLKIQNTADSTIVECSNPSLCRVNYRLRYTPLLQDVVPSNVFWDQQITLLVNPMAT